MRRLTFIGLAYFRHACLLFCKMPGHTPLPRAIRLRDRSGLSVCRSIPSVNNLPCSDGAQEEERKNMQHRVWKWRAALFGCSVMHPITVGLETLRKKTTKLPTLKFYMMNQIGVRDPLGSKTAIYYYFFFFFFKYALKELHFGVLINCTCRRSTFDW